MVDQYEKVQNFRSEKFWYIEVTVERDETVVEFKWGRNRLFDLMATLVIYQTCLDDPTATVTSVKTKPTTKWKPFPLTTVELQKAGSRLLHLSPKRTLDVRTRPSLQSIRRSADFL